MDTISISLQLMDPNCKPLYARAYTVPRSVEQQLQHSKDIVRLVDIGVLEEDCSSEWASCIPSFPTPKKNGIIRVVTNFRKLNLLLIHSMSPLISSMEGIIVDTALYFIMGYYYIKLDYDADSQNHVQLYSQ
jgi:hypothetical protein